MIDSVGGDVKPFTSVPVPDLEIRSREGGGGGGGHPDCRVFFPRILIVLMYFLCFSST